MLYSQDQIRIYESSCTCRYLFLNDFFQLLAKIIPPGETKVKRDMTPDMSPPVVDGVGDECCAGSASLLNTALDDKAALGFFEIGGVDELR